MPSKKKQLDSEPIDTFVLAFMGELVNVVTDIMIVDYTQNEDNTLEQNAPMVARGYLLDCDHNYLYLGENPLEVSQAIAKTRITMVQIDRKKSKYEELLDEMGDPNKREDIN
jgi:hypothetical protein